MVNLNTFHFMDFRMQPLIYLVESCGIADLFFWKHISAALSFSCISPCMFLCETGTVLYSMSFLSFALHALRICWLGKMTCRSQK